MVMERLLGAASLCALAAALAALNEDCRRFMGDLMNGETSVGLTLLSNRTMHVVTSRSSPLFSYMSAHLEMVAFAVVALVLLGLMMRS